jgi:hypothetical protein
MAASERGQPCLEAAVIKLIELYFIESVLSIDILKGGA